MQIEFFLDIIYFFIYLCFVFAAAVTWKTTHTSDKNVIFGVTLPHDALQLPEIENAKSEFRTLCLKWTAVMTVLFFPSIILLNAIPKHFILSFIYLMIWCFTAALFSISRPFVVERRKLRALKRDRGWHYGVIRETTLDTRASLLKNRATAPAWLFIPAVVLPAVMLTLGISHQEAVTVFAFSVNIITKGLFVWLYFLSRRLKLKVVSENSEFNIAVNCQRQHTWSVFWLLTAYVDSVFFTAAWQMMKVKSIGPFLFSAVLFLSMLVEIALVFCTFHSIRKAQKNLEEIDLHPLVLDDDDYWKDSWIAGEIYCNPNDNSFMVEKRYGIGMSVNIATKKGKVFTFGGLGLAAAMVIAVCILIGMFQFSTTTIKVDNTTKTVSINTFAYGTKFTGSSIESVKLINSIPSFSRTNGGDDGTYAVGHFSVDGYGACLMYIYENSPPYILIRTPDKTIFYNEEDEEKTLAVLHNLEELLQEHR